MELTFGFGYLPRAFPVHSHQYYEIHFFIKGKGTFNYIDKNISIKPNLFVINKPGELHSLDVSEALTFHMFHINPLSDWVQSQGIRLLLEELCEMSKENEGIVLNSNFNYSFERLRMLSHQEDYHGREAARFGLVSYLHEILAAGKDEVTQNDAVVRTIQYIRQNIDQKISLEDLSSIAGVNKHYLCRLFQKSMGLSPIGYALQSKIDSACHILSITDLSNKEIADYLALSDEYYFSKLFKKIKGITPSEYRKTYSR